MSHYDYIASKEIGAEDHPFYALIMAAMRQADTFNTIKLRSVFPEIWMELDKRYNLPGGMFPDEIEDSPPATVIDEAVIEP